MRGTEIQCQGHCPAGAGGQRGGQREVGAPAGLSAGLGDSVSRAGAAVGCGTEGRERD